MFTTPLPYQAYAHLPQHGIDVLHKEKTNRLWSSGIYYSTVCFWLTCL